MRELRNTRFLVMFPQQKRDDRVDIFYSKITYQYLSHIYISKILRVTENCHGDEWCPRADCIKKRSDNNDTVFDV